MSTEQQQRNEQQSPQRRGAPDALQGDNPTARVLREEVWRPPNRRNDWRVFVIVGREGTGKSLTCASILEKADPSFTAERVHFDPAEFMETMAGDHDPGTAVMLDEAGVGMGNRSWYEKDQIKVNKALQTARDDNMIIGLTIPRLEELDLQTKGRIHYFLETLQAHKGDFVRFKFQNWDPTRDDRNKIYRENIRFRDRKRQIRMDSLAIGPPSAGFIEDYEAKKEAFKAEYYDEVVAEYGDDDEEDLSEKEIADAVKEDGIDRYITKHPNNGRQYIDKDLIKMEYDLSVRESKRVKKLLELDDEVSVE